MALFKLLIWFGTHDTIPNDGNLVLSWGLNQGHACNEPKVSWQCLEAAEPACYMFLLKARAPSPRRRGAEVNMLNPREISTSGILATV
ncbi:hypothetical protein BDN67DRAFT_1072778 [Paxillus ammoniavirescens]|nr:hypothetical protein BDN67DRAFT_1072778 [Paxillus ammoniavirescens]